MDDPCGVRQSRNKAPIDPASWHEAIIQKVTNGFVIRIGCCTFVSKTRGEVFDGLADYWDDPIEAQKKYCK